MRDLRQRLNGFALCCELAHFGHHINTKQNNKMVSFLKEIGRIILHIKIE